MVDLRRDPVPGPAQTELPGARELTLLVVDDSRLYREGLASWLTGRVFCRAVETAASLASLVGHLERAQPDVVVLNLASVESASMLVELTERAPMAKLIVVGVEEDDEVQVLSCAEASVYGYITRGDSLADLVAVIEDVVAGRTRVPHAVSALLLRRVRDLAADRRRHPAVQILTDREIQILRLIGAGMSNKDIAEELTIELHTVKNHVHSLLTKLGVRRRGEAAAMLAAWDGATREPGIHVLAGQRMDPMVHAPTPGQATP